MANVDYASLIEAVKVILITQGFRPWVSDPEVWQDENGEDLSIEYSDTFYSPTGAPHILTSFDPGSRYPNQETWERLRNALPEVVLMDDY